MNAEEIRRAMEDLTVTLEDAVFSYAEELLNVPITRVDGHAVYPVSVVRKNRNVLIIEMSDESKFTITIE